MRDDWAGYIPSIFPTGSAPSTLIEDYYQFEEAAQKASKARSGVHRQEIKGMRQLVLAEAVYFLHKSSHVIGASESHARNGIQTWSLSGAYHGAMFGAKAIMYLLGVATPNFEGKGILVDVWPELPKLSSRERKAGLQSPPDMQFSRIGHRVEHRHVWQLFQRVIRVSKVDLWSKEYISSLHKLDVGEFAWQRNKIHYNNREWICADLHKFIKDEAFGTASNGIANALESSRDSAEFSVVLALVILKLALQLFISLTEVSNKLAHEAKLIKNFIDDSVRHPIYTSANL